MNFSELGLSAKVLSAIETAGYTTPTPIQQQAIPVAVRGQDVLGIAQTGTGKTAGFVLPMLTRLEQGRARARMPRSLILAPTRELAAQVAENFEKYGINHKLTVALLIGGVSFDDQNRKLDRGADVLIATPGRMLDHFQRGRLLLTGVEILVIDEADRMLDMGFIPDIERICSLLPPQRQTLFFSATMPPEIQRLVDRFLKNPERVEVAPQATAAGTITQRFRYASWDPKEKREALRDLIRNQDVKNAIIFCNRKKDVDILFKSLIKHGFNAGCLHGDMDQHTRTATLDAFRAGRIALLAASDVAARGLDIPDVSHVFNYDVPIQAEDYVHRIGRTGRAGKKGFSATIVTSDDMRTLKDIERMLKAPLEWLGDPPPEGAGEGRRRGRGRGRSMAEVRGRGPERGREGRSGRSGRPERDHGRNRHNEGDRRPTPIAADAPQPEIVVPATEPMQPASARERNGLRQARGRHRGSREPASASQEAETRHAGGAPAEPVRERPHAARDERSGGGRSREGRPRNDRPRSEGGREGRPRDERPTGDDRRPVVGLGDHVPAFLKRPVRAGST